MGKILKVYIICAAGASSGIIMSKIENEAETRGLELELKCFPFMTYKEVDFEGVDVIMLAPQVRLYRKEIEKFLNTHEYAIPMDVIGMETYGLMRGDVVLEQIMELAREGERDKDGKN
jgi:cellobiose-specific phosphotransferase system component IIB